MKDRAWFEARLAAARAQRTQLLANAHACDGVEQLCTQAINELLTDEARESESTTSATAQSVFPKSFTTTTADPQP